jgi:hypothetical protein
MVMSPSLNETPGKNGAPDMGLPPAPAPRPMPADDTSTTTTSGSPVLDDSDKIEKKWVNKARQIVGRTRGDPYRQNEELTVVKADYMKQRYNKIIKVDK